MDRQAEQASEVQRKSDVILSERSREIIRLFEELERKRHQLDPETGSEVQKRRQDFESVKTAPARGPR
jgi:hypothetical protein